MNYHAFKLFFSGQLGYLKLTGGSPQKIAELSSYMLIYLVYVHNFLACEVFLVHPVVSQMCDSTLQVSYETGTDACSIFESFY